MKILTFFGIGLLGIGIFVSGCDDKSHHTDALSAKVGYSPCWVYLNRQAIGEISSDLDSIFNVDSQGLSGVMGTLKQVTKEWIILEVEVFNTSIGKGQTTLWIPRNVVLYVRTDFNKTVQ
jgi:hypothetical protein